MKEGNYQIFFGMFANKLKVDIISALMRKPMGVTELSSALGAERSKVSHALLALGRCSIVDAKKRGRQRIYSIHKDTIMPLLRLADKHVSKHCRQCAALAERA